MNNKLKYILDIPKTIYFNFRVLPIKKAFKFPFFIGHTYRFAVEDYKNISLNVPEDQWKPFMVRFANGGSADVIPNNYGIIILDKGGKLVFDGECQFNAGCSIRVSGGLLRIGKTVNFNRNCNLSCINEMTIGDESLFGFGCSVRDSDGHTIIYDRVKKRNNKPIIIGKHNWICANSHIGKGTTTGADCVIGSNSVVTGSFGNKQLICGIPGKVVREIDGWIL